MLRRTLAAITVCFAGLSGLTWSATPALSAVSDESINPTQWTVGASNAVVLTWTESAVTTSVMVRSPWPWPATYPAGTTGSPGTETAQLLSATRLECAGTGIVFESSQFNVTAGNEPTCNYVNSVAQNWTGFYLSGGNLGMSAAPTITVSIPSGVVIAPSTPRTDTWLVGPYSLNYNSSTQTEIAAAAVAAGGSGVGEPVPMLTLAIDSNGGSCSVSEITGLQGTWTTAPGYYTCSKDGAIFRGFATSPDGTGSFIYPDGPIFFLTSNRIYAIYEEARTASAPTDVVAVAGKNKITVSWKAPADPGSGAISNYLAQASPSGRVCITSSADADPLSCTFNLPATNTQYSFKVQALNIAGWGAESAASNAVSPYDVVVITAERPKAGFFQRLAGWGSTISMNGRAPGFAPGAVVTPQWKAGNGEWVIESRDGVKVGSDNQISWSKKIKRNLNREPISVRFAVGDVTSEEYALRIGSTVGVPAAPRDVKTSFIEARVPAQRRLQVSWEPPTSDGGFPITSYEVSAQLLDNSAPVRCRVNADQPRTCILPVGALDGRKTYTVKVTAINDRGKGQPGSANFRRPA